MPYICDSQPDFEISDLSKDNYKMHPGKKAFVTGTVHLIQWHENKENIDFLFYYDGLFDKQGRAWPAHRQHFRNQTILHNRSDRDPHNLLRIGRN